MSKRTVERKMFYNASPEIFRKAELLRSNMTEAEKRLWEKLRNSQLGLRFKAQHPIDQFIVDFYCHKAKLVIEIDGEIHIQQREYDLGREYELKKFDLKIIRFTNDEVLSNIDKVINRIKKHL